ncbi:unnamed protein product [Rhizophagus irregularis]|nr:unnamed protein product [Rhizophagus irregularis]
MNISFFSFVFFGVSGHVENSTTFQLFGRRICARIIVSFWNLSKTNLKECQSVNERINPPLKYKNITPPNKKLEKVVSLPTPISYDNMPMMPNCLCKKGKEGQLE